MTPPSDRRRVDRRTLLTGAVAAAAATGALAAMGDRPARAQGRKATFVLVHGAWHGGWCWQRMTPLLRAAGHEVYAPTLTGLGERAHLGSPHTSLNTHIADIVAMLQMEDLRSVVLVGHSYAGFVVTGVADRSPSRIKSLVYVNAFVPDDGKSLLDYVPADRRAAYEKPGKDKGYFESFPLAHYGLTRPEDIAWVQPRITTQPYATFAQPLKLRSGAPKMPKAYVRCTDPVYAPMEGVANRFRADPNWKFAEVAGGHDAMVTNPRGFADALLSLT